MDTIVALRPPPLKMPRLDAYLKAASLHDKKFATRREAMDAVLNWIAFYNHRRLHSSLGYLSPMQYEQRWHAAQHRKAA